jgi:hypothetical protein
MDFLDPIYPIELEKKIPQIELGLLHTLTYIWKLTMRTDENFTTKKMISIFPASLLAATLYQGNHVMNHMLWNIESKRVITKLPNSEQSNKGKYINRQNQ